MTILPVKKKREKEAGQKATGGSSQSESVRQQPGTSNSSAKRNRHSEEGPPTKRIPGINPPSALPPLSPRLPNAIPSPSSSSEAPPERRPSPGVVDDYNSDDEYQLENIRDDDFQLEAEFSQRMANRGMVIKEMVGDGACMFRAIAEQIYGDQEMHGQIRTLCMDYMSNNKDHFEEFITEHFESYIRRKRDDSVHGNHVELQAISEIFARPVEVYQYSDQPINILLPRPDPTSGDPAAGAPSSSTSSSTSSMPTSANLQNPPLRLSYHRNVHYNAIISPNVPTIGVGLGLPGMVPGSADQDLLSKAMAKSELEHIEETMLQDKIGMTDYQRTQADIEDQIARESLVSYFKDLEKKSSGEGPSTSSATSSDSSQLAAALLGPLMSSDAASTSSAPNRTASEEQSGSAERRNVGLYEELLAAQSLEWDAYTDDVAVAEALLLSQQDYLSQKPGPSNSEGPSSSGGPSQ